jgi:hypothetical protein
MPSTMHVGVTFYSVSALYEAYSSRLILCRGFSPIV